MKYYNYKSYKTLKCGADSKQCGGACVDKDDVCSKDREAKIDKGIVAVKEELSSLERGGSPGKVFNKTVATLLIEDKNLGQKLPLEMANTVAVSKTVDDRVKKSYINSATSGTYNMSVSPKEIVLAKEDRNFTSMISNRLMAKGEKKAPPSINNGTNSEKNFFQTENGKTVLKLLGATAVVGATTALASYSIMRKQDNLKVTDRVLTTDPGNSAIELDVNRSFLKNPANIEADEIVNESLRRTGLISESTIKNNVKKAGDSTYTSQSVYEEYKDIYNSAMRVEKERQSYGADKFTLRQNEDYKAYWGLDADKVTGKAIPTPDSRLGRAESRLEDRIKELNPKKSAEEIALDVSKAKAMMQNKELLSDARSKNQVYNPETKTWERRTYSNGLDANNPDISDSQNILIARQQEKNLEKSYLNPDGSTIEMDKFQQDGTFARGDRNKGNVPIVDIDDIKQRHDDAWEYDNTRKLTPKERWDKLNDAGDGKNKLLNMFVDAEIAKDLSSGTVNESGIVLFGMKHERDKGYNSVKEVLNRDVWLDINDLRNKKLNQLNTSINNGHDPFPAKPTYKIQEDNISKTDNVKDRFGALGSAPRNLDPRFVPEKYIDELSTDILSSQKKDWDNMPDSTKNSYIDSQILRDATRGEVYAKEILSGTDSQRVQATNYVTNQLESIYVGLNGTTSKETLEGLREMKRKELTKAINSGKAVLPEYISQTSPTVTGQQDKDYTNEDKRNDDSIGTVENVASVNASGGGPKQNKAAKIAESTKPGAINVFKDIGAGKVPILDSKGRPVKKPDGSIAYKDKYVKRQIGENGVSIRDKNGKVFTKIGSDYFINGRKVPVTVEIKVPVYGKGNFETITKNRSVGEILEEIYKQFQFSENYTMHNMEVLEVIEHKGNVTVFSTVNDGIVAVIYDVYNDTFSHVRVA